MVAEREPTVEERALSAALGGFTERLVGVHRERGRGGDEYSYETSVGDVELGLNLGYFYGGPGAPQCTLVSRLVDQDGQRVERLFSWSGPSPQTNWLHAGYVCDVVLPDQETPYFDHHFYPSRHDQYLSRVHPPVETALNTEGPITPENLVEIQDLIDKITNAQFEEAEAARVKRDETRRIEKRDRLIHSLAGVASKEISLASSLERLSAEISSMARGVTVEIESIDDEELKKIISKENSRLVSSQFVGTGAEVLARVRAILQEALEAQASTPQSEL